MKLLTLYIALVLTVFANIARGQQKLSDGSDGGAIAANVDAILELASKNKGLLHARVSLVSSTNPAPLSAHIAGMMVYNTEQHNDVVAGIYYNNGSRWVLASSGTASNITYDPATYQLTFINSDGTPTTIDFKQLVQVGGTETETTLTRNNNGTYTYKNEKGTAFHIDPSMVHVTVSNGVYTFRDADGNPLTMIDVNAGNLGYNNAGSGINANSVQEAIDEIFNRISTAESTNIVETGVDYTAAFKDAVILGDASAGDITIILPEANIRNKGKKYTIKKEDNNEDGYVNVVGNIIGVSSDGLYTALPFSGWDLVSDGTRWRIVNKF
ncbi:hypothetical protein FAZ15_13185 [Sphingobacterium olei]|uniref:Uncharacterized protein n=1 Tax=Sphingobacterium olei TaxID=2571155 RepID=A0A4U0NYF2_9SPHI|nr:hypothetical protein [Sphingobacterium olei]TJZ59845.1 hypothetical protein FAZ15_13185 [Sphingobacterium olei]